MFTHADVSNHGFSSAHPHSDFIASQIGMHLFHLVCKCCSVVPPFEQGVLTETCLDGHVCRFFF